MPFRCTTTSKFVSAGFVPFHADSATDATVTERVVCTRLPQVDEGPLVASMREHGVVVRGEIARASWWEPLVFHVVAPGTWRLELASSPDTEQRSDGTVVVAPRSTAVLMADPSGGRPT